MRKKFICGNWKMNGTAAEARKLLFQIRSDWSVQYNAVDVAVCPPFTALYVVAEDLDVDEPRTGRLALRFGAQNCYFEETGAFTGEIAPSMLVELGCTYVILGHSERRTIFGETDVIINHKLRAALAAGLEPIFCIGETEAEREAGTTEQVLERQLLEGLTEIEDISRITVAYEPVWAIGTGKTATPEMAQEAHAFIRRVLRTAYGAVAENVRIQYGGSLKPENARELLSQPDIDGGLIGGASLKADSFLAIIEAAAAVGG